MKTEFGCRYKNVITGFVGIMRARVVHITGCDRIEMVDEEDESKWVDLPLIKFVDDGVYEDLKDNEGCNKFDDVDDALYELGSKAKDKLTDFEGIIMTKSCSITGDICYGLTPRYDPKATSNDALWVDEGRIELIQEKAKEVTANEKRSGGATPNMNIR